MRSVQRSEPLVAVKNGNGPDQRHEHDIQRLRLRRRSLRGVSVEVHPLADDAHRRSEYDEDHLPRMLGAEEPVGPESFIQHSHVPVGKKKTDVRARTLAENR